MTDRREGTTYENLLGILDNVIHQLDFTKKMAIIMVVSFIVIVLIIVVLGSVTINSRCWEIYPNHRRRGFSSMAGSRHQTVDGVFKMEAQVSRIQGTSEKG